MLIDDHRYIAERLRQITIEEGRMECPTCKSRGWHEYCDEEGAIYFTECGTCRNPHKLKAPAYTPS
jgi:hypothetical protein